ncbi:deacetylase sulfotransferase [Tateyamaria omphalii]|uniref:sulfotransferase family protein n=1 Tax=Tateyamaria omphalii TaxID=299262 RepID=UPI00167701A1|nr:sulfotransferase [Tateyamaria omphalii]GGX70356.1 deacetylase sulfotransferase [Tateyamaria omphalii]
MSGYVDFIVAGAQKSGTTAMRHFLSAHPQIGMPRADITEPHYFSRRYKTAQPGNYAPYHALYDDVGLAKVTCDVTPIYVYLRGCLERAHAYNPDMKVVVILRNPVDRAYSQWNMERRRGKETRSFLSALAHELWVWGREGQHPVYSYLQRGLYARQIRHLTSVFPEDQCKFIKHEDFKSNYAETLKGVFAFLGVNVNVPIPAWQSIHTQDYKAMPKATRLLLRQFFSADIRQTEALLGWDCTDWRRS